MKKLIVAFSVIVLLFGCVTTDTKNVPIADNCANDFRNHKVACTARQIPDFFAQSGGKAAAGAIFGAIGSGIADASMTSEGNKIIRENGVKDPANYIADQLVSSLAEKYQLNQVNENGSILESDDVKDISTLYKSADYVLDVKTVKWEFSSPNKYASHYYVIYEAKLRLIDTNQKSIVAEGYCRPYKYEKRKEMGQDFFLVTSDNPNFSYDELIQNDAEVLKNQLKVNADSCVDFFKKDILALE